MLNARSILILSLGANLLLGGWLLAKSSRRGAAASASPTNVIAPVISPGRQALRVLRTNLVEFSTNTVDAPGFRWSQLETNDFRAYAANLRGVGCPENTLRHIIVPDVEKAFRAGPEDDETAPFWENASQTSARNLAGQRRKHAQEAEKRALLRELVGVDWPVETYELWIDEEEPALALGYLPDAKVLGLLAVIESIAPAGDAIKREARGLDIEEDAEKLRALAQSMQRAALAVLSPAEAEEFLLRCYDALQDDLFDGDRHVGVEMTGVEYRELIRQASSGQNWVEDMVVAGFGEQSTDIDDIGKRRPETFDAEARALLGDTRYAAYQRSRDEAFTEVLGMAKNQKLPVDSAIRAYDIRLTAIEEARRLFANDTLTPDQRKAALAEMQQATAQAVQQILGQKDGERYARTIRDAMKSPGNQTR